MHHESIASLRFVGEERKGVVGQAGGEGIGFVEGIFVNFLHNQGPGDSKRINIVEHPTIIVEGRMVVSATATYRDIIHHCTQHRFSYRINFKSVYPVPNLQVHSLL